MRVLIDGEEVIEVRAIFGMVEEYGAYTVFFEYADGGLNEGMQFEYEGIGIKEAQARAKRIIREALEKGFVDVSDEPWDMIF